MNHSLIPEFFRLFKSPYSGREFTSDLIAGVIVGIVALPLAIAFAIASGVKPEQGIYTSVIAGLLISVFSGSKVQIGGPTGAFIIVVFGIVQKFGYQGLVIATMMAGILLIIMGVTRMGEAIRFIPYPMTVGFTSAIALIIFTTQIQDFFGLTLSEAPGSFIGRCEAYTRHFSTLDPPTLAVGGLTLLIMVLWPRVTRKVPGSVVAILLTTLAVQLLNLPVETIGSRFGEIPTGLPRPVMPHVDFATLRHLVSPAFTIAMLAAIESLLSAVVADGITGDRHNSNMELVGQGIANFVAPIFGGIPATGAIARTATNIKSGGKSPVAGVVHAATLLLILICFGKWAKLIPMATLAAILMVVAYHMSEWRFFVKLLKSPRSDIFVMVTTFLLTLLVDLTVAIETGVVLASVLFMNRMANATIIQRSYPTGDDDPHALTARSVPEGVDIFEIQGPFFFGAANKFKDTLRIVSRTPRVLIIRCRHILFIDATALRALEELVIKAKTDGIVLMLSGVHAQPLITLEQSGLYYEIGAENIFCNIDDALNGARRVMKLDEVPRPRPFVPTVAREMINR